MEMGADIVQSAVQGLEDAAALAEIFDPQALERYSIPELCRRFEALRKPRTSTIQNRAHTNRGMFELEDGPQQEKRDAMLAQPKPPVPDWSLVLSDGAAPWFSPAFYKWLVGYEVTQEVRLLRPLFKLLL